jgi:bud emergence protein 1
MKSLRKSLNSGSTKEQSIRHHISTPLPLPPVSKPPASILPPQKVIRALSAYRPQAPQELSFQKGDFFYVIKDVDIGGSWYEAHNPVSGARGLVPKAMFEEFNKTAAP